MMHEFHCPLILIYYKSSLIDSFSLSASFVLNFLICRFFLHFLSLPLNFADVVFYFSHFLKKHTLTNTSTFLLLLFSYHQHFCPTCKLKLDLFTSFLLFLIAQSAFHLDGFLRHLTCLF